MELSTDLIGAFLTGLGGSGVGAGISWGVLKTKVSSLSSRLDRHEKDMHDSITKLDTRVDRAERDQSNTMELLARVDTKVDMLLDKKV